MRDVETVVIFAGSGSGRRALTMRPVARDVDGELNGFRVGPGRTPHTPPARRRGRANGLRNRSAAFVVTRASSPCGRRTTERDRRFPAVIRR